MHCEVFFCHHKVIFCHSACRGDARDRTRGSLLHTQYLLADIARALFVSRRTLGRRLDREGTGYREIRDDVLAELAARHLRESDLTVEAIAALLGYHDTSNFRRAFRRWFGISPGEFRRGQVDQLPQAFGERT